MKSFRKSAFSSTTCLATAAIIAFGTSTAAQAQDAAPADSAAACADANDNGVCDKDEKSDIVVVGTGSRLSRPTLSSPVPLTSVSVGELTETADISLGDALNDLPSLRSTYSQGNSTRFIGTAGLNLLDLRGLGISRTLVLVNGKRHITASPGDYLVDVNTIPVDLLERVDVVTGGNSAVYGSDAVAGVVNFVMKRNYEGFTVRGQGAVTSHGDRGTYFLSATWGKNFADGRGNIAVSGEYARTNPLYFRDRDDLSGAFSGRCQINQIEPTGAEEVRGTDGIWDTAFVCGIRNASISDAGTIGGLGNGVFLRFNDAGNLFVDTPTRFLGTFTGNVIGGNGSTLRNTGIMAPGLDRYSVNLLSHYDFSDLLRFSVEAKYVRITANNEGQPTFMASATFNPTWRCDNGFLDSADILTLQGYGICSNVATGTFPLSRFNIDLGGRGETHKRETYRIVGGFDGTFNDDWKYELSFNYGELRTNMNAINVLRVKNDAGTAPDGLGLAVDAVLAPVGYTGTNFVLNGTGQKVICRVNFTTITRPDCVPINLFGQNQYSPAASAFVNGTAQRTEKATQFVASFNVGGDFSQLFELPGGPIGFVLGTEYREETAFSAYDQASRNGAFFFNQLNTFAPPKFTVKEAYGEIDLPLLKDLPFARELSVRGAGRVSDYNTPTGTVWAWNVDAIWAPIEDIRFRASYATSVRTPTQSDLYAPQNQNFAFLADPCDSQNVNANPSRAANCAAAGVPTTYNAAMTAPCSTTAFTGTPGVTPWRNCTARTSSVGFTSGGNSALVAEKGKSLTVGMVLEPRMIPGLSVTVDYYNIEVKSLIAALSAQATLNFCYDDAGGLGNPFCATVNRDPATGLFVQPALITRGVNFAKQKTEGFDVDVSYRKTFENGHKVTIRAIATRVTLLDNYVNPVRPDVPDRQLGELGDPVWAANFSMNYDFGPVDVTYSARYTGKQTISTWEAQHTFTGVCPTTGITGISGRTCTAGQLAILDPQNADFSEYIYYPGVIYHNIRVNFQTDDKKFNFYVGADNFMNKKPPFGLLGNAGGDPYDTYGAFYYAGFRANF